MAEKLSKLRKNGGSMSETVLWTNSSPTSNFAAQTVNLSDDITKFDYIRVYFYSSKTSHTEASVLMLVSDFVNLGTGLNKPRFSIANANNEISGTGNALRILRYISNTSLNFTEAYEAARESSSTTQVIPTKISGLK